MRAEAPVPQKVLAAIRAPFEGAVPIDPPVIQPLGVLLDLAGEAMRARLFIVGDEGGREACLRADFTIPVALEHIADGDPGGRYSYEGKAFRVSPPGAVEHAEEFLQVGLEAFGGDSGPVADAAILGLAWRASAAGGRKDLSLRLGDIALFGAFLDAIGVSNAARDKLVRAMPRPRQMQAELARALAGPAEALSEKAAILLRQGEDEGVAALEAMWAADGLEPVGGRSATEIVQRLRRRAAAASAPRLTDAQAASITAYLTLVGEPRTVLGEISALARGAGLDAALAGWRERLDLLTLEGIAADRAVFAAGFARPFSYYDGFLFEVRSATLDASQAVAGGGRYDALLGQLGGPVETAVGCMVRPARAWAKGAGA